MLLPPLEGLRGWSEDGKVYLSWKPLEGAVSYEVLSEERGVLDPVARGLKKTSYVDTQVEVGRRYSYQVHGIDRLGGKSSHSGWVYVTVAGRRER